jgi:hypothetical protein
MKMRKVQDHYAIDEDELFDRSATSDYFSNALGFWITVRFKPFSSLTESQITWLDKIVEDLED